MTDSSVSLLVRLCAVSWGPRCGTFTRPRRFAWLGIVSWALDLSCAPGSSDCVLGRDKMSKSVRQRFLARFARRAFLSNWERDAACTATVCRYFDKPFNERPYLRLFKTLMTQAGEGEGREPGDGAEAGGFYGAG